MVTRFKTLCEGEPVFRADESALTAGLIQIADERIGRTQQFRPRDRQRVVPGGGSVRSRYLHLDPVVADREIDLEPLLFGIGVGQRLIAAIEVGHGGAVESNTTK